MTRVGVGGVRTPQPACRAGGVVVLAVGIVAAAAAVLMAALVAAMVWLSVRHPFWVAGAAATTMAWATGGPSVALVLWSGSGAAVALFRSHDRQHFDRWVLGRWRRELVYGWRWRRAMVSCDLARPGRWRTAVPRLGTVRSTRWIDMVSVHPLSAQDERSFTARSSELAQAFGVLSCRPRSDATGVVRLEMRRGDPLRGVVPPIAITDRAPLGPLPIGRREDGSEWVVTLTQGHILIAGDPGSGKGSVVWSLIRALAVPVRDGIVELWGVDGTGGTGLFVGAPLFTRLTADDPQDGAAVIEDVARLLRRRAARAGPRIHVPSRLEPLIVLVLDEIGRWGNLLDEVDRRRLAMVLDLVLVHGHAAGIVVVATVPAGHPALAARFPQRVALRLADAHHACTMLGVGGHTSGAACGQDTRHLPGVGLASAGGADHARVRATWLSDDQIMAMSRQFEPVSAGRRGSDLVIY